MSRFMPRETSGFGFAGTVPFDPQLVICSAMALLLLLHCRVIMLMCHCYVVVLYSCCCIAVLLHDHIVMLLRHHAVVSAGVSTKSSEKIREMTPGHAEMLLEKIACCLDKEPSGSWSVEGCHVVCGVGE